MTGTGAVTGSFEKIQAAGPDAGSGGGVCKFTNITFGRTADPIADSIIYNDVADLFVSSSGVVDGPIHSFKLANGQALAYYANSSKP